jgi:hypothetical protein
MWVEKFMTIKTLRPVGTRYKKFISATEYCTYGAMLEAMETVFLPTFYA